MITKKPEITERNELMELLMFKKNYRSQRIQSKQIEDFLQTNIKIARFADFFERLLKFEIEKKWEPDGFMNLISELRNYDRTPYINEFFMQCVSKIINFLLQQEPGTLQSLPEKDIKTL